MLNVINMMLLNGNDYMTNVLACGDRKTICSVL